MRFEIEQRKMKGTKKKWTRPFNKVRLLHYWLNLFLFFPMDFIGARNSLVWPLQMTFIRWNTLTHKHKLLTYIVGSRLLMATFFFFFRFNDLLINAEDIAIKLLIYGHTKVLLSFPFPVYFRLFGYIWLRWKGQLWTR